MLISATKIQRRVALFLHAHMRPQIFNRGNQMHFDRIGDFPGQCCNCCDFRTDLRSTSYYFFVQEKILRLSDRCRLKSRSVGAGGQVLISATKIQRRVALFLHAHMRPQIFNRGNQMHFDRIGDFPGQCCNCCDFRTDLRSTSYYVFAQEKTFASFRPV